MTPRALKMTEKQERAARVGEIVTAAMESAISGAHESPALYVERIVEVLEGETAPAGVRTIWKHQVAPSHDIQHVALTKGAKLLALRVQDELLCMWTEHDQNDESADIGFYVLGTGWRIPGGAEHVATEVTPNGWVWHLYRAHPTEPGGGE